MLGKTAAQHILLCCHIQICTLVCLAPVLLIITIAPPLVLQVRTNEESLENNSNNNHFNSSAHCEQNKCLT